MSNFKQSAMDCLRHMENGRRRWRRLALIACGMIALTAGGAVASALVYSWFLAGVLACLSALWIVMLRGVNQDARHFQRRWLTLRQEALELADRFRQ